MGKIEYTKAFYEAIGPGNGLRRLGLKWAETGKPVKVAIEYTKAFYEAIGPGKYVHVLAFEWAETGQPVEAAIAWAKFNYLPHEAEPLIKQGMTPELASAGDDLLIQTHGVVGAILFKLRAENPAATILVDPDIEDALAGIAATTKHMNTVLDLLGPPPGEDGK